jgi:RNA polymerase sigma-70 factor (ECF subfamily)
LNILYTALLGVAPTMGARVAAAVVTGRLRGPDAGLAALPDDAEGFQPYWAARAELLARSGRDASAAYLRAADLAPDPEVGGYLRSHAKREPHRARKGPDGSDESI